MVNIFVKTIISASMNMKLSLLLLLVISQFSFSNNTDFLTNDSINKNDDVYLLMLVDELKRIVLPHSGIHANFSTYYYHIVRELIALMQILQQAVVINVHLPAYRWAIWRLDWRRMMTHTRLILLHHIILENRLKAIGTSMLGVLLLTMLQI